MAGAGLGLDSADVTAAAERPFFAALIDLRLLGAVSGGDGVYQRAVECGHHGLRAVQPAVVLQGTQAKGAEAVFVAGLVERRAWGGGTVVAIGGELLAIAGIDVTLQRGAEQGQQAAAGALVQLAARGSGIAGQGDIEQVGLTEAVVEAAAAAQGGAVIREGTIGELQGAVTLVDRTAARVLPGGDVAVKGRTVDDDGAVTDVDRAAVRGRGAVAGKGDAEES